MSIHDENVFDPREADTIPPTSEPSDDAQRMILDRLQSIDGQQTVILEHILGQNTRLVAVESVQNHILQGILDLSARVQELEGPPGGGKHGHGAFPLPPIRLPYASSTDTIRRLKDETERQTPMIESIAPMIKKTQRSGALLATVLVVVQTFALWVGYMITHPAEFTPNHSSAEAHSGH